MNVYCYTWNSVKFLSIFRDFTSVIQVVNTHCKTVPKKALLFSSFLFLLLLQKEHPQWIQHVSPPDLWLLLDIVTVGSPFRFLASLVSMSAVPSYSSHKSISSSALLQLPWMISSRDPLACNKMPGMCQCDTSEEAIRSTIHLHMPLP